MEPTSDTTNKIEEMCRHIRYNLLTKEEGGFSNESSTDLLQESVIGFMKELEEHEVKAIKQNLDLLRTSCSFARSDQTTYEEYFGDGVLEAKIEEDVLEAEIEDDVLEEEEAEEEADFTLLDTNRYYNCFHARPLITSEDIEKRYGECIFGGAYRVSPLREQDYKAKTIFYERWIEKNANATAKGPQFTELTFEKALALDFFHHSANKSLWEYEKQSGKKLKRLVEMALICHFAYKSVKSFTTKQITDTIVDSRLYSSVKDILGIPPHQDLRFSKTTILATVKELYYNTFMLDSLTVPLSARSNHIFMSNASLLEVRPTYLENATFDFSDWIFMNVLTSWLHNEGGESYHILLAALIGAFGFDQPEFLEGLGQWLGNSWDEVNIKLMKVIERSIPFEIFQRNDSDTNEFELNPKILELRQAFLEDAKE